VRQLVLLKKLFDDDDRKMASICGPVCLLASHTDALINVLLIRFVFFSQHKYTYQSINTLFFSWTERNWAHRGI